MHIDSSICFDNRIVMYMDVCELLNLHSVSKNLTLSFQKTVFFGQTISKNLYIWDGRKQENNEYEEESSLYYAYSIF